jgi:hypothetical protein
MIRCGLPRWDAKTKICAAESSGNSPVNKTEQKMEGPQEPALAKKETDNALAKLLAERAKLDNFWKQAPTQDGQ